MRAWKAGVGEEASPYASCESFLIVGQDTKDTAGGVVWTNTGAKAARLGRRTDQRQPELVD